MKKAKKNRKESEEHKLTQETIKQLLSEEPKRHAIKIDERLYSQYFKEDAEQIEIE